ncbi:beta 1-4 rhamnosyltransferase Cps2T [Carnobacterium maltaromaticum]|uniref:beta 1-4 rhamnosyltransferase Cps2T n=1 Tax=Carnobacterium maltaromaticum TaxID=2751 RepID=UPI0039AF6200
MKKNVFIVGSKGIPANYGGFETFVEELTKKKINNDIMYHVACMVDEKKDDFIYNKARCFNIKVPNIGPAKAIYYDVKSLFEVLNYIKTNNINNGVVYILACRIGPFMSFFVSKFHKLGMEIFVNPDGHEWKRKKWNYFIQKYWKLSEKLMIKYSDLIICDSKAIKQYILEDYSKYSPKTCFIPYGADVPEEINNSLFLSWADEKSISFNDYYLIVGRFVPENNYELIIKEFTKSHSKKDLVIVTNIENNGFYKELQKNTNIDEDKRIKFVGTVYNQELLTGIRTNAFGYFHGHEVGGTNPSLLEAMAVTKLNILLNVSFNKEVGQDGAIYFEKTNDSLRSLIEQAEEQDSSYINRIADESKRIIKEKYNWDKIVKEYEFIFMGDKY